MTNKDLDALKQQSSASLLEFLRTEASIGKTLVSTAKIHSHDAERYDASKRLALQALETINKFIDRVPSDAKAEIEAVRAELAATIATLL